MENTSGFFIGNLILMKSVVRCFSIFNGALLQLCAPNCVSWPGDRDGDGDGDGAEAALLDAAAILTSQSRLISADKPWLMVLKLYKHICVSSMSPVLHDQILIRGRCCFKVPTSTVGGGEEWGDSCRARVRLNSPSRLFPFRRLCSLLLLKNRRGGGEGRRG